MMPIWQLICYSESYNQIRMFSINHVQPGGTCKKYKRGCFHNEIISCPFSSILSLTWAWMFAGEGRIGFSQATKTQHALFESHGGKCAHCPTPCRCTCGGKLGQVLSYSGLANLANRCQYVKSFITLFINYYST